MLGSDVPILPRSDFRSTRVLPRVNHPSCTHHTIHPDAVHARPYPASSAANKDRKPLVERKSPRRS